MNNTDVINTFSTYNLKMFTAKETAPKLIKIGTIEFTHSTTISVQIENGTQFISYYQSTTPNRTGTYPIVRCVVDRTIRNPRYKNKHREFMYTLNTEPFGGTGIW